MVKISKQFVWLLIPIALSGCAQKTADGGNIIEESEDSSGANLMIASFGDFEKNKLPPTKDMKLANYDLVKYVKNQCGDDISTTACEVYVQPDKSGLLLGYLVTKTANTGTEFHTDMKVSPSGKFDDDCYVAGALKNQRYGTNVVDATKDFGVSIELAVHNNGIGNPVISDYNDQDLSEDTSIAEFRLEKNGEKLTITQGKWNYCYQDQAKDIDEVFYLLSRYERTRKK